MAKKPLPTPDELRQLLRYEPDTGKLFWLEREPSMYGGATSREWVCRRWNSTYAGKESFTTIDPIGYFHGSILGYRCRAHRVAWALAHGDWPLGQIDHINGVKTDNRLVNLRDVTHAENGRNAKRTRSNTSGVTGVRWYAERNKWVSKIMVNGVQYTLGYYLNFDDAVASRKAAEVKHGFHPNHGRG